jgi:hypothetical protein
MGFFNSKLHNLTAMKIFNYLHAHSQDIEFYAINGAAVLGSLFTPFLQELKEVMGVVVLCSVAIYNFYRIKNERKKNSDSNPTDSGNS